MSALVNALDKETALQTGENGHIEHGQNKGISYDDFRERIVQFYFQLVRSNEKVPIHKDSLAQELDQLLNMTTSIKNNFEQDKKESYVYKEFVLTLYKILAQTRDIIAGKGEYNLSYMQLVVWWKHYPALAKYALHMFVNSASNNDHPYGSWKDIKNFCQYANVYCGWSSEHPFIEYACKLMEIQLRRDVQLQKNMIGNENKTISLAGRWAPRESSKQYRWIANIMAELYYPEYFDTAITDKKLRAAKKKALMDYRKTITSLNRSLDTIQIKMCEKKWKDIDHTKTTSQTLQKSKNSLRNVDKRGITRTYENEEDAKDRAICAENFIAHLEAAKAGDERHKIRGKRVGVNNFVKDAIHILQEIEEMETKFPEAFNESRRFKFFAGKENVYEKQLKAIHDERDVINMQWKDNATQNTNLRDIIAMVDTSGSMLCDDGVPLYSAIGLGIRIAEKSSLGKRIMTFSSSPEWVNLDECTDFVDCVNKIRRCNWGMNTNFYKALQLILDAIVRNKMSASDVENLTLVILSDMQIDCSGGWGDSQNTMFKSIEKLYEETGMRVCGQAYKPPHIVFWNLRRTTGFPSSSDESNVTMTSGFSTVMLNQFSENGVDVLKTMTPWTMMKDSLEIERYMRMEQPYGRNFDEVAFTDNFDDVVWKP